jgi:hypothetical protein
MVLLKKLASKADNNDIGHGCPAFRFAAVGL